MPEIIVTSGDIFESGCRALVNPVDCTGAQGAGLAKVFAGRFPSARDAYRTHCRAGGMAPGDVWAHHAAGMWLLFAATKHHYRNPSCIEWVDAALDDLVRRVNVMSIASVAIPALGCGLGGLDWDKVRPLMLDAAARMQCDVVKIYEPR